MLPQSSARRPRRWQHRRWRRCCHNSLAATAVGAVLAGTLGTSVVSAAVRPPTTLPRRSAHTAAAMPTVYVSAATGHDNAPGTAAQPLRTLAQARDAVRAARAANATLCDGQRAAVWLLPGRFALNETLELGAQDSNTTWQAIPAPSTARSSGVGTSTTAAAASAMGTAVVSGGVAVNWTEVPSSRRTVVVRGGGAGLTAQGNGPQQQLLACRTLQAGGIPPPPAGPESVGFAFPQLYVNGSRARVAALPVGAFDDPAAYFEWLPDHHAAATSSLSPAPSWLPAASNDSFVYNASEVDPSRWGSVFDDVTALVFTAPWDAEPRRVAAVDTGHQVVTLRNPVAAPLSKTSFVGVKRWLALNVPVAEALVPGSYRYESRTRTITYVDCVAAASAPPARASAPLSPSLSSADAAPPHAGFPADAPFPEAFVPVAGLDTIVRVGAGAEGVRFEGVAFRHTATGAVPSSYSYGPAETGTVEVGPNASGVSFAACTFSCTGNNALQLRHAVQGVEVAGSAFHSVGGRGFTTTLEHTNADQDAVGVSVADSVFAGCGEVFHSQPYCVFVSGQSNVSVVHNDISGVSYSGIRVWGFDRPAGLFDSGVPVFNISFNHVHGVGLGLMSDFGGIFVTSRPGAEPDCLEAYGEGRCNVDAVVAHNVVHGVRHFDHAGIGIYTDESSGRTNITHNLVFDCGSYGLHLHCGWPHVVDNNVFAGNVAQPASPDYAAAEAYASEPFCNFEFHTASEQGTLMTRNVFDQRVSTAAGCGLPVPIFNNDPHGTAYGYSCAGEAAGGCPANFPGNLSLAAWQAVGMDAGSVAGDPGLSADPDALRLRRDFRVWANRSAAVAAVGFNELALASVGPRAANVAAVATCNNDGGDAGVWWRGCDLR